MTLLSEEVTDGRVASVGAEGPRKVQTGPGEPHRRVTHRPAASAASRSEWREDAPSSTPTWDQVAQVWVEAGPWGNEATEQPLRGSLDIGV